MSFLKNIIYIFLIINLFNINLLSQCCTAGNPSGLNSDASNSKNNIFINLSQLYSYSDTYFSGINKTDNKYSENSFNFTYLNISYGLFDNINILTDIGYYLEKSQTLNATNYKRYTNGLADLSLGIKYNINSNNDRLLNLSHTIKVTIPVGQFEQEYDGIVLPIDFQPSSGNYKYYMGLNLSKRFNNSDLSFISNLGTELSQTIVTKNTLYKYGNFYNFSFGLNYIVSDKINSQVSMKIESRDKALIGSIDQNKNDINKYSYVNSTGGTYIYLSPMIGYSIFDFNISSLINIPIYKNINGEQLTNKFNIIFNISKNINIFNQDIVNISDEDLQNDKSIITYEIKVRGNCDMCKERIEDAVKLNSDVIKSDWDSEREIVKIYTKNIKIDLNKIKKEIANVGHDTDVYKAEDNIYKNLPECCLYRDNK